MKRNSGLSVLTAAGLAALATYFFDAQQGRRRRAIAQQHWAPATRFMAGAAGASLAARAISRRSIASPLLLLGGLALLARAATNMDLQQMLGQRGRRSIDLTKTIRIAAPASRIYAFWSNFENFPRFMRNVLEVRRNTDDSWHWKVAGPLGAAVEWDARITQVIPDEVIAWSTKPGAAVEHAGIVRFREEADGATRVHVRMSYNPVAGALGRAVASLFGADPAAEMDDDLMRLKTYFETGKPARDAAQPVPAGRP